MLSNGLPMPQYAAYGATKAGARASGGGRA